MIIVRVELHSAVTGTVTEIARMRICNRGDHASWRMGNYEGESFVGRDRSALDKGRVSHRGTVDDYPREALHVWNLVGRMLRAMGYTH